MQPIVLVDADDLLLEATRRAAARYGSRVLLPDDDEQALRQLSGDALVVIGWCLPRTISGIPFIRDLRSVSPGCRIVVVSALDARVQLPPEEPVVHLGRPILCRELEWALLH